jgi:hypothetical protein
VNKIWEHNKNLFAVLPRKITLSKAGGFIKARYEGRKAYVFGFDEKQARQRLKMWDGGEA